MHLEIVLVIAHQIILGIHYPVPGTRGGASQVQAHRNIVVVLMINQTDDGILNDRVNVQSLGRQPGKPSEIIAS